MDKLIDRANYGTGTPLAGDSALKKLTVRIDFSTDGSLEHSWNTAETAVGWDTGSPEMRTPEFVDQSIAVTITTRSTSIEAIG